MARCDYDAVFYRVFCITLLVTAFTFAVILTNVFIDIDGLLLNRKKYVPKTSESYESYLSNKEKHPKEQLSDEDKYYDNEIYPSYRTKRSIDSENIFHTKHPAIKKMLIKQLASLLEELDEEDAKKELTTTTAIIADKIKEEIQTKGIKNDDLLHLALHNILLQGLVGHMDVNDVYKKVQVLIKSFNERVDNKNIQDNNLEILKAIISSKELLKEMPKSEHNSYNAEHDFFEELMNCKKLEEQIAKISRKNANNKKGKKDGKTLISTVIEINESNNGNKEHNYTSSQENVEGLIKLMYNGKSVKIKQMEDEMMSSKAGKGKRIWKSNIENDQPKYLEEKNNSSKNNSSYLINEAIEEYLEKHPIPNYENSQNSSEVENIKAQRLKRQIKIRYFDNVTIPSKIESKHEKENKEDDDLYIEIETHFDGKGIKGEKKKKLIRNLIDKIQKALHPDIKKNLHNVEHMKFIKRTQNPIYSQNMAALFDNVPHHFEPTQLDAIDKTLNTHQNVADKFGGAWKKEIKGPNFLSISKSVNSAEMNELAVDSVLRNGISKRLQKPLNTGMADEDSTGLSNSNADNVTLFLKDIDGTGFSIGFNQYVGEPPDKDSLKMFNGIENLIREYHKTYDQEDTSNESAIDKVDNFVETDHELVKRNVQNLQKVYRRSITERETNYFNTNNMNNAKQIPLTVDQRILRKKLTPKIITLDFLNRKRRSVSVKTITNLKSKIKLNRYLNTKKVMSNKKILLKNKRYKRHVNNIRIIARDRPKATPKNSDENIFFISREKSYYDKKSVLKGIKTADTKVNNKNTDYDDESYFENIYRIQSPNVQTMYTNASSNSLMSKYPHIFIDTGSNSKEDPYSLDKKYKTNDKPYRIEAPPKEIIDKQEMKTTAGLLATFLRNKKGQKVEIVNDIMPLSRSNYKVTLKVLPKNKTFTNAGFKEVHTSVNKSFDEDGLRYFSLLNVSQISKVEKLNKTYDIQDKIPLGNNLNDPQKRINILLQLHKNRVDIQLNSLLRESNYLGKIIESNRKQNIDKTLRLFTNVNNGLETANEEKVIDSVLKSQKTSTTSTESERLTTILTSKPTIDVQTTTETPKIDEWKILETMKQNEKVTFEILNKIEANSQILKSFFQKFSDKLDSDKKEHIATTIETNTEKPSVDMKLDLSKDWKAHGPIDAFFIPNESKNDTIPFVYAYQQSFPMKNKTTQHTLASLVYHGHIHTNQLRKNGNNFGKSATKHESNVPIVKNDSRRTFNESKFFLDELNRFKVIQNKDRIISANIKINTTSV